MPLKSKDLAYRDATRKALGEQILALMNRKGVSSAELAERLETREHKIEKIIEGRFSISADFLFCILDALDTHIEFVDKE